MTLQISRAARAEVKALLAAQFNTLLASACDEFDISDQAFEIDYADGSNFWEAPYTWRDLQETVGQAGSAQTLSTKSCTDEHQQMPCSFNGPVAVQIETFLRWTPKETAALPDTESLCDAVEAALTSILNAAPIPTRAGTLTFERGELQFDKSIWYRSVLCSAEIEVTA